MKSKGLLSGMTAASLKGRGNTLKVKRKMGIGLLTLLGLGVRDYAQLVSSILLLF